MGRKRAHGGKSMRRRAGIGAVIALAAVGVLGAAALGYVGFMLLRPQWPATAEARDAPTLPISVGGVAFNIPPAAIRFPPQRRAGAQPRLDLAFQYPEFTPRAPGAKAAPDAVLQGPDQLLLSIEEAQSVLAIEQRVKEIYTRYLAPTGVPGPGGLGVVTFRDGTPYQGEDLVFDPQRPEHFLARCTRKSGLAPGICLLERRLGAAELIVRFPRDWLGEWRPLTSGLDRLIAALRAAS